MHGSAGAGGAPHVSPTQLDPGGGGVEVEEHVVCHHPADAAPLVRDLDSDVVRALDNVNLDEELLIKSFDSSEAHLNLGSVVSILMELHGSSHAVLEHLEEHVVQVTGDVDEVDLVRVVGVGEVGALEVELGSVHVDLITEERGILIGLASYGGWITGGVNGSSESISHLPALLRTEERLVVSDQHLHGDAGHVETVQEVLNGLVEPVLVVDVEVSFISEVVESLGHPWYSVLNMEESRILQTIER